MKYFEVEFKINADDIQTARDLLIDSVGEAGFDSFEETIDGVKGYVQMSLFSKEKLDAIISDFILKDAKIEYFIKEADNRNWNILWEEEGFEPILIGNKCIIHDTKHNGFDRNAFDIDITIDAVMAFGTGTHQTTKMIVCEMLNMNISGKRVLDCGCGTGILSIVASKSGAKSVVAYDIDEWSINNTVHNAAINRVENIEVFEGDSSVLSHINGVFDVVLANINRNVLLCDMEHFKGVMTSGSKLIISGFYENDIVYLLEKANEIGLKEISRNISDEWACLILGNKI